MMEPQSGRTIGICFCLLLLSLLVAAGDVGAQDKSFLWRVQSDKGNIYILGSVHFLKKENYPLSKTIEQAFDSTQKLVLEIDLKSEDTVMIQRVTLEKGINRDRTLQQSISPETYGLAEKRAQELGMDIRALSPLKPWVVALTMTALQLQKLGFDPNYGVDRYLAERAAKSAKPVLGLETAAFQIGLIDQLPEKNQESMLRQSLKEMDLLDRALDQIVRGLAPPFARGVAGLVRGGRSCVGSVVAERYAGISGGPSDAHRR